MKRNWTMVHHFFKISRKCDFFWHYFISLVRITFVIRSRRGACRHCFQYLILVYPMIRQF